MEIWAITHHGVVREQNQDAFAYHILQDGRGLALVCDGMGGARAGNIASSLATEYFVKEFLCEIEGETDQQRMERAGICANHQVYHRARHDESCMGMGTTLVAALVGRDSALVLNEGDSRGYHIAEGAIRQVTRDHSLVADLVERGDLTQEQARSHPHKNLITRALGAESALNVDYFSLPMGSGEYLLLCSDGLSNVVTEQEMLFEVLHGGQPSDCCQRLLDIALERGAPDNVTVVLLYNA